VNQANKNMNNSFENSSTIGAITILLCISVKDMPVILNQLNSIEPANKNTPKIPIATPIRIGIKFRLKK